MHTHSIPFPYPMHFACVILLPHSRFFFSHYQKKKKKRTIASFKRHFKKSLYMCIRETQKNRSFPPHLCLPSRPFIYKTPSFKRLTPP